MHCPTGYWLVKVYIAISDFNVKPAVRIGTHPCLVVYSRPLASVVGKGDELAHLALETLRNHLVFHKNLLPNQDVPKYIILFPVFTRLIMRLFVEFTHDERRA